MTYTYIITATIHFEIKKGNKTLVLVKKTTKNIISTQKRDFVFITTKKTKKKTEVHLLKTKLKENSFLFKFYISLELIGH